MSNVYSIINAIDSYLQITGKTEITAVEAASYLDEKGILNDSTSRRGKPLRELLRKGKLPHAYQIGKNWFIPSSKSQIPINVETKKEKSPKPIQKLISEKVQKLEPIAKHIRELLRRNFGVDATYSLEFSPEWSKTYPNKELITRDWSILEKIYSILVDGKYNLEEQLSKVKTNNKQKFDIWFHAPYNFAVEFDEKQHLNMLRLKTLNHYKTINSGFNVELYKTLSDRQVKPGTSGFQKLKSIDLLFPELLIGEKQDNRIRQRAFRDSLKDILPINNNCNPTIRIPYKITNDKINNFNNSDLESIEIYIQKYKLFDSIRIK